MSSTPSPLRVVVAGDVVLDWNLVSLRNQAGEKSPGDRSTYWNALDKADIHGQRGGTALLADLVKEVAKKASQQIQADIAVLEANPLRRRTYPGDARVNESYALWTTFKEGDQVVWRVENYLGMNRTLAGSTAKDEAVVASPERVDLVILDDAGLDFRTNDDLWPRAIKDPNSCGWVLLKSSRPIAQGLLWDHLRQNLADRLIVVMSVDDLRLSEVQISRELSWERTAQDLAWELVHNPQINALSQCAHVVVLFHTVGAMLFSRQLADPTQSSPRHAGTIRLVFDPAAVEGTWTQVHPGGMIGYTSCLVASIARQLMLAPAHPDLEMGIQRGLAAMRKLHLIGYQPAGNAGAGQIHLQFPTGSITEELTQLEQPFARAEVRDPVRGIAQKESPKEGDWTILEDRYPEGLDQLAEQVLCKGPEKALSGVPMGKFGFLLTVDRQEIEAYRSIRALVREYSRKAEQKPLSIAVFGNPGSGKSFGITQVATSLLPDQIKKPLTFNLSQFGGPHDLLDAFHQVRDVGLSGQLPLVFWDEFDAACNGQPLGWLAQFLAPMQDGVFQEGQLSHPLGRAIFVFAGGTSARMEEFGATFGPDAFRQAKGPDFISRLKGFADVLGPNPVAHRRGGDPHSILRRAIILNTLLRRQAPHLFEKGTLNIDPGVMRALLHVSGFHHGARSMEALIAMSVLSGKLRFERSCLPAEAQLNLHVDGTEFLAWVQRVHLEGDLLEKMAEATHNAFCALMHQQGYCYGERTDDLEKTHSALRPYAELPEDEQEQNRNNARDIPAKLDAVGYVMIPARSHEPAAQLPEAVVEHLAEMEHCRWLKQKVADGWRWAPETDKSQKRHRSLLPWQAMSQEEIAARYGEVFAQTMGNEALSESEKEKDRVLIREIPRLLAAIGYTVSKIGGE